MAPYLIFTDLDGTLLDHNDYSFSASAKALKRIDDHKIPLIINSSKTMPEIAHIRTLLNNNDPFIAENGAAIYIPRGVFTGFDQELTKISFSLDYERILGIIHRLRSQKHYSFVGFHDLSNDAIKEITGLPESGAITAQQRTGTEPILWQDKKARLQSFKEAINEYGLKLVKGGRFYHVMGQKADKANAMSWLTRQYRKQYGIDFTTIALGDSDNDKAMLEQSDLAAVIRRNEGTALALNKKNSDVIYTLHQAPQGWQEAIDEIFKRIKIGQHDE
ncbi:MAG: HAD-IIB family hydrolase [Gammaproteobacteria bacterium]